MKRPAAAAILTRPASACNGEKGRQQPGKPLLMPDHYARLSDLAAAASQTLAASDHGVHVTCKYLGKPTRGKIGPYYEPDPTKWCLRRGQTVSATKVEFSWIADCYTSAYIKDHYTKIVARWANTCRHEPKLHGNTNRGYATMPCFQSVNARLSLRGAIRDDVISLPTLG